MVRCSDNSLYSGQTNNLEKRIMEHNSNGPRSAKYLRAKKPVKLVYSEEYPTIQLAMKREWQVKRWKKSMKEELIFIHQRVFSKLVRAVLILLSFSL